MPPSPDQLARVLAHLTPLHPTEHRALGLTAGYTPVDAAGIEDVAAITLPPGIERERFVVGIDGGADTGFAVYRERSDELVVCTTTTFWGAVAALIRAQRYRPAVVIEDPSGNRPTFHHGEDQSRKREKISRDVGANAVQARLLAEACALLGLPCLLVTPGKGSRTKASAADFAAITGWRSRTSEHARDAGLLCFGRTVRGVAEAAQRRADEEHDAAARREKARKAKGGERGASKNKAARPHSPERA